MFEIRACEYSFSDCNHVQMVGVSKTFFRGQEKKSCLRACDVRSLSTTVDFSDAKFGIFLVVTKSCKMFFLI